jgi:hypothetical protein
MLDYFNKKNPFVAKITGLDHSTILHATGTQDRKFSKWAKFTLWVFDELRKEIEELKKEKK